MGDRQRHDDSTNTNGDVLRRRIRKHYTTRQLGDIPPRLVEVKGIGRNSAGRYCDDCGHPRGRCVCHHEPDEAA